MRLLLLASVALLGCPKSPQPSDSGMMEQDSGIDAGRDAGLPMRDAGVDAGWAPVPVAQWCHSRAVAQCWRDMRCGRIDEPLFATCLQTRELGCDSSLYVQSNAAALHQYDPVQASRCLNAHDEGSCEETPASCATVFVGMTPPDGGALVPEDCDGDAGFFDLYDNTCPHRCSRWAEEGERCNGNTGFVAPSCRPGVGCEYADSGFQRFCQPGHAEGQPCDSFDSCAAGLTCSQRICVKRVAAVGEPCGVMNGYPFCSAELFCRQGPPDMNGQRPPGVCQRRAGLGGTCSGFGSCLPSLRCTSLVGTGTCQRRLGAGEPCSISSSLSGDCQDGLYCPPRTSRCAPLPADGGDCSSQGSFFECAPGYYCDGFPSYVCRPLHADGEACSYNGTCLSNECQYVMFPDAGQGYRCVRCSQVADGGR